MTCASTGAGDHTVGLKDSEDLVSSNDYEQLASAIGADQVAKLTLGLGDTMRVTEDLTNPTI
jgi:hypothetical protein